MTKKITGFIILCLAVFMVTSVMAGMPGADPKELWEHITKTSPYTQWKFWDDHQGMLEGNEPHGSFNKVYVNDKAYDSSSAPFKYGAIVVKENYNKKKKLMALTVMYKVKDYNPGAGDWFYARYTTRGKAKPYGQPKGCVSCHSANADNDFIFVHDFE
jgi:hypothetical protein